MSAVADVVSPTAAIVLAGSAVVAVGGILAAFRHGLRWGLILQAVGMTGVGVGGATLLLGAPSAGSGFTGSAGAAFGLDPLTGFFLVALGACSVPALVFAVGYVPGTRGARLGGPLTAGIGVAESPRGETVCMLELDDDRVGRLHLRTASLVNWPAVAHAAAGSLLPDFPLINKSFELCYACSDR